MVELALVLPLLMLVLFGIVEFGITYNNYIAIRDGTREAAREGAVGNFGTSSSTGSPCYLTGASGASDDVKKLMCLAKTQIGLGGQNVRVKVLSGASDFTSNGTFAKADSIIVCAQLQVNPITGLFTSILGHPFLRTKAAFRIEKTDLVETAGEETPLSGGDWSWCTVSSSGP